MELFFNWRCKITRFSFHSYFQPKILKFYLKTTHYLLKTWGCILYLQSPKDYRYQVNNGRSSNAHSIQTTKNEKMTWALQNPLKIYYKIVFFVSFGKEMCKILRAKTFTLACLNVQVLEWTAIDSSLESPLWIPYMETHWI